MKCIIAGSRSPATYRTTQKFQGELFDKLTNFFSDPDIQLPDEIVSGGGSGADEAGEAFAYVRSIDQVVFCANWKKHGKAAGPIRNEKMAHYVRQSLDPALVVLWDMKSPGTRDMIKRAEDMRIKVYIIDCSEIYQSYTEKRSA